MLTQTNTTNAFSAGALRAGLAGNPVLPSSERTLNRWFNTDAFAQPAQFTFGNSGRGILRGEGIINVDMSLAKNVSLRPARFPAGSRGTVQRLQPSELRSVGSIDVMPTLLHAAGITPSSDLPGIDLLDSRALAGRTTLFGSLSVHTAVDVASPVANLKYRYATREDGWKLILPFTPNRNATLMIDGRTRTGCVSSPSFTTCSPTRGRKRTGRQSGPTW